MLPLDIHFGHEEDSPESPHTTNEKLDKNVRNNNLQTSDSSQHQAVIPEKRETHQVGPPIAQASCLEGIPPKTALTPQAPAAVAL